MAVEINATEAYFDENETLHMHPFVNTVGQVVFIIFILVFSFGIPANVYVLWRMRRLAVDDNEKYTNGSGIGLLSMGAADLLSLCLISTHHVLLAVPLPTIVSPLMKRAICKALIFSTHTATSVSIWSWLLMSALRYLAVKHPIYHWRLWHMPHRALAVILLLCSLTNVWLLIAVDVNPSDSGCDCVQTALSAEGAVNRYLHLIETIWSFCIPVIAITYMDAMVLVCAPHNFLMTDSSNPIIRQRSKKAKLALQKWLIIAFIDIALNTPENVYRLVTLLGLQTDATETDEYNYAAKIVAQMLYFTQFAFNSLYLLIFIFDRSTKPRTTAVPNHTMIEENANQDIDLKVIAFRRRVLSYRNPGCTENIEIVPRSYSWHQLESIGLL